MMLPALFSFLKIALATAGLLWFHTNFRIICSSSMENIMCILIGVVLNVQTALGSTNILTILIHPIHDHMYPSFISVISYSFHQCLILMKDQKVFHFLFKFFPTYFVHLHTLINGISFCIAHSNNYQYIEMQVF